MKKYRVYHLIDNTYHIVSWEEHESVIGGVGEYRETICKGYRTEAESVFQGNLTDCNAWLQLNDKGYM